MKKLLFFCMALMSFLFCKKENMQIKLKFDDEIILIQMDESPAAKQFMSLLPLRLKFSDYANKEKISPALNPALTQKGKANYEPETGDFFYFAHWKNLGIFYEKQPAHSGLVYLGKVLNLKDLEKLRAKKEDFWVEISKN